MTLRTIVRRYLNGDREIKVLSKNEAVRMMLEKQAGLPVNYRIQVER